MTNVTIYRRVVGFTPLLADAARPCRHVVTNRAATYPTLLDDLLPAARCCW